MEATIQSVIPVRRILHNREPPEHSMPDTTLQPANPAKRIQLLDWLKSGIHKSEKNCPQRVSLCSTSQTQPSSHILPHFITHRVTHTPYWPDG